MKKLMLLYNLNKFYKIFGAELGFPNFHMKLRDFQPPNLLEVLFDINQILEAYEDCFYEEAYQMSRWLENIKHQINNILEE